MSRRFKIIGRGIETNRARVRIYDAVDEAHARRMAAADDTRVEEIYELSPPPPTVRQVHTARDLGIQSPELETKESLKRLVSEAKADAEAKARISPTSRQIAYAKSLGILFPERETKDALSQLISDAVEDRNSQDVEDSLDYISRHEVRKVGLGEVVRNSKSGSKPAGCFETVGSLIVCFGALVMLMGVFAAFSSVGGGIFLTSLGVAIIWFGNLFMP